MTDDPTAKKQGEVAKTAKDSFVRLIGYMSCVTFLLLVAYFLTGFYTIEQDKLGVLQRFGKVIHSKVAPGMHYAFPWPIDKVDKIAVKQMITMNLDDFAKKYAQDSAAAIFKERTKLDPYCITGDNNIVNISLVIKYNVTNPTPYLFRISDMEALLRHSAASTVIHTLASMSVDDILTTGKDQIRREVEQTLLRKLNEDAVAAGLSIAMVELRDVSPPERVQSYFDDVINAKVEKDRMLEEAKSYRNRRESRARSDAMGLEGAADAYANEREFHAVGDTKRFKSQLAEHSKAKAISRTRIYLEFIRAIYPKLKQVIIVDNRGRKRPLNLKILTK